MATLTKASDIDLTPIPGKQYFNLEREWREEFIYFLMVDRFHDGNVRSPVLQAGRSNGISTPNDFFRWHDQRDHQSPRLHSRTGMHGYMDITDLREQPEGIPRLRHQ